MSLSMTCPHCDTLVPLAWRIATFDQGGTLWVEHPIYSQVMYVLESVAQSNLVIMSVGLIMKC